LEPGWKQNLKKLSRRSDTRLAGNTLQKKKPESYSKVYEAKTVSQKYYISESSVYRILKSFDLICSLNYIVMSVADKFQNPTKRINELWQPDFTYFKIVGWGWYYLATVLDDYS
jgi:hypothetical protein